MSDPNESKNESTDTPYICGICKDVMKSAVGIPCGHEFCYGCLTRQIEFKNPPVACCKMCNAQWVRSDIAPAYKKRTEIECLKITCTNCKSEMTRCEYEAHSTKCKATSNTNNKYSQYTEKELDQAFNPTAGSGYFNSGFGGGYLGF